MLSAGTEQIYFNLLLNSACSFAAGLMMVYLTLKLFRIGTNRWKLAFLTLPFLKILWDMHFGIPPTSFLYHGIDPLHVLPRHKILSIGLGFSDYHPTLSVFLGVQDQAHHTFSISVSDFIWALLKRVNPVIPKGILAALLTVSVMLLFRRVVGLLGFEQDRRSAFADPLKTRFLEPRQLAWRHVQVLVSSAFSGTPFTGGLFRPYICIPAESEKLLTPAEKEAVVGHELAHIRNFDLLINLFILVLGDVFWFVPGYRRVSGKIDRLREILADDSAVKAGASPVHLASALLKIASSRPASGSPVLYSAFFKDHSLLKERVVRLTGGLTSEKPSRFGWNHPKLRWIIAVFMAATIFSANVGGNYDVQPVPDWLTKWFDRHGWHVE